jgi:diguanylate cyclase (GGDEF)-like protein
MIISITIFLVFFTTVKDKNYNDNRSRASSSAYTKVSRISQELDWYFSMSNTDATLFEKDYDDVENDFDLFSRIHAEDIDSLKGFAILTNDKVVYSYQDGVDASMFLDFYNNEYTKNEFEFLKAHSSYKGLISGVYDINKTKIFYVVQELYTPDNITKKSPDAYYFIFIDLNIMLKKMDISSFSSQGYQYEIIRTISGIDQIIESTVTNHNFKHVGSTEEVDHYGSFTINVYSPTGFESIHLITFNTILILIITILLTVFSMLIVAYRNSGKKYELLSNIDRLTGIPNRRAYEKRLKDLDKANVHYTVLFFDINDFKSVNDNYGHDFGDVLLKNLAEILNKSRESQIELACRIGGDEFAVIVPNLVDLKNVEARVYKLKTLLNKDYVIYNTEIYVSVAIGSATNPLDATYNEKIMKIADDRMYQDKQNYKNRKSLEFPK